jgi:hypothetical protein
VSETISESPDDTKAAPKYRVLLGTVILLGVLMLLALGALVGGFIVKSGRPAASATAATAGKPVKPAKPVSMTLAPGYKILSSDTQPGRLILHVRSDVQDEIDVIDLEDGRIITQIHATAPQ